MMVKRIASGPPHQFNIRICVLYPVKIEGPTRVKQQVSDTGHWNKVFNWIFSLWKRCSGNAFEFAPDVIHRAVTKSKPATKQTDLAEH